jgi:hypothetical protein
VLPGTFDCGFATGLSYKNLRSCVDEAEAMGMSMVCGAVVHRMFAITNAKCRPRLRPRLDCEDGRGMGWHRGAELNR